MSLLKRSKKAKASYTQYRALDVARYIVDYSDQKGYLVSSLKLQKLLYFIQASYLTDKDEPKPCFSEEILAWSFGPVVLSVYDEFKQFGAGTIPVQYIKEYMELTDDIEYVSVKYNPDLISPDDKVKINAVVDFFADYSATAMTEITFGQKPWKDAYNPILQGEKAGVISNQSIEQYFQKP